MRMNSMSVLPSMRYQAGEAGASRNLVAKYHGWGLEGRWFKPQGGHDMFDAAVGPSSKALNPRIAAGRVGPLFSLVNRKSLWTKESAKLR